MRLKNYAVEKSFKESVKNSNVVSHSDKINLLTSTFNNALMVNNGKDAMDVCEFFFLPL